MRGKGGSYEDKEGIGVVDVRICWKVIVEEIVGMKEVGWEKGMELVGGMGGVGGGLEEGG